MSSAIKGVRKKCCAELLCKEKTLFNGMCDSTHKCAVSGRPVHAFCSEPHEEMRDPLNAMSEIEGFGSVL